MKLIHTGDILSFVAEGNETEAEQAFLTRMSQCTIKANGSSILLYDQKDRLITCIKPFDNTQFLHVDDGYQLASDFGAKRFLVGEARQRISDEKAKEVSAIHFSRDLSFPIEKKSHEMMISYQVLDLEAVLNRFQNDQDKLYNDLSELFNRCADFTPGKQNEYLVGGKKEDKYCRFNLVKSTDKSTPTTSQVFLIDDDMDKIIATFSASIIETDDGTLDIYFYDEVVDYFILLDAEEKTTLDKITQQLNNENDDAVKSALKKEIASLVEPKRTRLMAQLFAAMRQNISSVISNLDEKIEKGQVHAFIRAADGRVEAYTKLGCSTTNRENYVIHGPATDQLKMLDAHIKKWAAEQLKALQPKQRKNLINWQKDKKKKLIIERANYSSKVIENKKAISFDNNTSQVSYEFEVPPRLIIVSKLYPLVKADYYRDLPEIQLTEAEENARKDFVDNQKNNKNFKDKMQILVSDIEYDESSNILYFEVCKASYSSLNALKISDRQLFKTGALAPLITTDSKLILLERSNDDLYSVPSGFLEGLGEEKQLNWENSNLAIKTAMEEIKEEVAGITHEEIKVSFTYNTLGISALSFRKTEGNAVGTVEFIVPFNIDCDQKYLDEVLKERKAKDAWEHTDQHVFISVTRDANEMLHQIDLQEFTLPGRALFLPIINSITNKYDLIVGNKTQKTSTFSPQFFQEKKSSEQERANETKNTPDFNFG